MRKTLKPFQIYVIATICTLLVGSCGLNPGKAFLETDTARCTGCAECTAVCPVDAVRIINGKAVIDPSKCVVCGKCTEACPVSAIQ
jgi:ferredoxin